MVQLPRNMGDKNTLIQVIFFETQTNKDWGNMVMKQLFRSMDIYYEINGNIWTLLSHLYSLLHFEQYDLHEKRATGYLLN